MTHLHLLEEELHLKPKLSMFVGYLKLFDK